MILLTECFKQEIHHSVYCLPITIISLRLKAFAGTNGVPTSFALLNSSFLSVQYRIPQTAAAAAAQNTCSFESMFCSLIGVQKRCPIEYSTTAISNLIRRE